MEANESIEKAIAVLQDSKIESDEHPAVIRLAPDSDA
jgi:hypothetical protein